MSETYIRRIKSVQTHMDAARAASSYVIANWDKETIVMAGLSRVDFGYMRDDLEATYFVRMFSVFEGILREHMAEYHSGLTIPDKVGRLIDRVAQLQTPPIHKDLKMKVHEVRESRNSFTHMNPRQRPLLTFPEARAHLAKYLDKLPDPH